MRFITTILLFLLSSTLAQPAICQTFIENEEFRQESLRSNLEFEVSEVDYQNLLANPIDINGSEVEILFQLGIIDALQLQNLKWYLLEFGRIKDYKELQAIPGWTVEQIRHVKPLVQVTSGNFIQSKSLRSMLGEGKHVMRAYFGTHSPIKSGFSSHGINRPKFEGNPFHLVAGYSFNYDRSISCGLLIEKDPGEKMMLANHLPDHLVWHIYLRKPIDLLENVAIGSYRISLGQGLITHASYSSGLSGGLPSIKRAGEFIRPFKSRSEFGYLNGVAMHFKKMGLFQPGIYGFSQKEDAAIDESGNFQTLSQG